MGSINPHQPAIPPRLDLLPFELIIKICEHLYRAQDVAHISQACRRLYQFNCQHGWKRFVHKKGYVRKHNFDIQYVLYEDEISPFQPNGLPLEPAGLQSHVSGPRYQSISYRPMVDSKMEFLGLNSRRKVVVWSTGPGFILQSSDLKLRDGERQIESSTFTIEHPNFHSGVDDIVYLNLAGPSPPGPTSDSENIVGDVIVGRTSGLLHRYSFSKTWP